MPILPSLDQQLRTAREASASGFVCAHIDTCLPDYLHDHHNRDGELLLGVVVFGDTSIGAVKNELLGEFDSMAYDLAGDQPGYDHSKARKAIIDLFADVSPNDLDRKAFDPALDLRDDEDDGFGDYCQAWFLITWETESSST